MIFSISIVVLDWIIHTLHFTVFLPIVLLAARFRNLGGAEKWYLFVLITHLTAGLTSVFLYQHNINPNYGGSTFSIVAVIFYIGFFTHATELGRRKKYIYLIAAAHFVFGLINLAFIQKETINTYSAISLSIIVISLCLLFFYQLLKKLPTDNLLTLPLFWFITAEFMTNTGQMLMKSFAHFLINIFNDNLIILWVLHHGLGILGNLFIIFGAWIVFRRGVSGKANAG